MKKGLSIVVLLGLLFLVFQFGVNFFKKEHAVSYDFNVDETSYQVEEKYYTVDKEGRYQIKISDQGVNYVFEQPNRYNKQKKILRDIKTFDTDGYHCLFPIYQNNNTSDFLCSKDGRLYTYDYLKTRVPNINNFVSQLVNEQYQHAAWTTSQNLEDGPNVDVYRENIPDDLYFTVWVYRGIDIISKKETTNVTLLNSDNYENNLGTLADHYFVIPSYDQPTESTEIYIENILTVGKRTIDLEKPLANDSYINGIVDGKLYLFDRKNRIQYEINPKNNSIREIGNVSLNAQFYDGENWSDRNIYDFINNDITFGKDYSTIPEIQNYHPIQVEETTDRYYILTNDKTVYKIYKDALNQPILLFQDTNLKEWKVYEDYIFYISDNTIYCYHEDYGLKPVLVRNEFRYNDKNIYDVYKK